MIDLKDFIKESTVRRIVKFKEWQQMYEDFTGEHIEDIGQELYDFTLENLKSHNSETLIKKINEIYPNIECHKLSSKGNELNLISCIGDNEDLNHLKNNDNLLAFFNYFVAYNINNKTERKIILEPTYPEAADDLIKDCHLRLYHICSKTATRKILKSGLRCKGMTNKITEYSSFPNRIYCLAIPFKYGSKEFNDQIEKFFKETEFIKLHKDLLQINLNLRHYENWEQKFYKDERMLHKYAVFTYHNIPNVFIEKIEFPKK